MAEEKKNPEETPKDAPKTITVKLGTEERAFGADDVARLVEQASKAESFLRTTDKYEISPEDYLAQSEGAFAVVRELIDKGLIDESGKVIAKETPAPKKDEPTFPGLEGPSAVEKKLAPVLQALQDVNSRLSNIEKDQDSLLRLDLEREVKGRFPELDSDDVSRALALASRDSRKGLWDHVADIASGKKKAEEAARMKFAKEFGIDLETFDKNKLREEGPEGGGSALFGGKKFSFKKKGEGYVSPKQATMAFFRKFHEEGG